MQGTWVWLNLRASLCIQRYLKPQIINSDGHMRKRPQKHGFVIQCGCNSSAMSPLPVVSSLLSLALHLGSLNDQAWVMRVTSSHILWIKTVNLTGRGRHSLSTSFDMFVAAISLNGMCAENRGQWDSESEVAEHFELVIISLKNHVCSTMREAPCLVLVSSCFCGNWLSWHLLSSGNCLPSALFCYCSPLWYLLSFSFNSYHQNLGVTSLSIFPALATVLSIRLTFPSRCFPHRIPPNTWNFLCLKPNSPFSSHPLKSFEQFN